MKGIWPSERVNSQVDWLRADLSGTSAPTFTDKYFGQRQQSKQTKDSDSLFLTVSCLISLDFSLTLHSLSHALSFGHPLSSCLHSLTVCSVPFPRFGFSLSSYVSLFLLAGRAHKSSSDTSLSWKDRRSSEKLQFSKLQQLRDNMKHSSQRGAVLEMVYFKTYTDKDPGPGRSPSQACQQHHGLDKPSYVLLTFS